MPNMPDPNRTGLETSIQKHGRDAFYGTRPARNHLRDTIQLSSQPAEEEGFEPPELALGGFQDRCLRPLGHSSRQSQR